MDAETVIDKEIRKRKTGLDGAWVLMALRQAGYKVIEVKEEDHDSD